ncbi:MAG: glycosyltransferase family 2 protein [Acidobacteriota bacterium]
MTGHQQPAEKVSRTYGAGDVSFIVPVGGAAPAWPRSAASLARLDPPPKEIIAVIDGPDERLRRLTEEHLGTVPNVQILALDQQGGPGRARNHGARAASGDLLFFTDSDIEVPPGLAAQVAEPFNRPDAPAAVMGSYDDAPGDPGFFSQYRNLLHHYVHQTGREQASTFWAGCGAVHREVFLDAGGYDEAYGMPSIEDIELGTRWVKAGHEIRLVKDLQVKHLKRWSFRDMVVTDLFRRAIPWTELMLGDGEIVNDLNVKTRDRLSVVTAFFPFLPLAGALFWPQLLLPALITWGLAALLIVGLNPDLFAFYRRKRGFLFAAGVLPAYWVYLWICGAGFGGGMLRHLLKGWGR